MDPYQIKEYIKKKRGSWRWWWWCRCRCRQPSKSTKSSRIIQPFFFLIKKVKESDLCLHIEANYKLEKEDTLLISSLLHFNWMARCRELLFLLNSPCHLFNLNSLSIKLGRNMSQSTNQVMFRLCKSLKKASFENTSLNRFERRLSLSKI